MMMIISNEKKKENQTFFFDKRFDKYLSRFERNLYLKKTYLNIVSRQPNNNQTNKQTNIDQNHKIYIFFVTCVEIVDFFVFCFSSGKKFQDQDHDFSFF